MSNRAVVSAIEQLLEFGQAEAVRLGFPYAVESSDVSESRYLHVQREETWFGYRIASHEPFHNCSADYQQILLPEYASGDVLQRSRLFLGHAIRIGGYVVADPAQVREFIVRTAREQVDGVEVTAPDGTQWCWDALDGRWIRLSQQQGESLRMSRSEDYRPESSARFVTA